MRFAPSISERIYAELRKDLIDCRMRPGDRLRTNELAARFGASLSAVREALVRLAAEGLAVADPRRGFRAAPISSGDLRALTGATCGIEALCIEASLTAGDAAWELDLVAASERIAHTPPEDPHHPGHISADFAKAHIGFGDALVAGCRNAWLLRLRASLDMQAERYRQICLPKEPVSDHRRDYREILAAALKRNIKLTTALVTKRMKENAERFAEVLDIEGGNTRFLADELGPPHQESAL